MPRHRASRLGLVIDHRYIEKETEKTSVCVLIALAPSWLLDAVTLDAGCCSPASTPSSTAAVASFPSNESMTKQASCAYTQRRRRRHRARQTHTHTHTHTFIYKDTSALDALLN